MDKFDDYYKFDMYGFGKELCKLAQYKADYYRLLEAHESLQKQYDELLGSSVQHGEHMMGNFLKLALYGIGDKPENNP